MSEHMKFKEVAVIDVAIRDPLCILLVRLHSNYYEVEFRMDDKPVPRPGTTIFAHTSLLRPLWLDSPTSPSERTSVAEWKPHVVQTPPAVAEFLVRLFAKAEYSDDIIGSRQQDFHRHFTKYGRKRAVRFYWADTLKSLPPQFGAWVARLVKAAVKRLIS